jgi:SAM-dependent methyltransferase
MNEYISLEAFLHDIFWDAEGEAAELPLLLDFLRAHPGDSLEIGCGSGRLLLPLLEAGHTVEGLELSRDMLNLCRQNSFVRKLHPVLHHGDMTTFDPGRRYTSILVPAFTLQLAENPAAALARFATLLEPRGSLYLTTFLPFAEIDGELPENEWYPDHEAELPDGRHAAVHTFHTLDLPHRILRREHRYAIISPGGEILETHESDQTLRWFDRNDLEALLQAAGFTIRTVIADFDPAEQVSPDTQILTVHADSYGFSGK